MATIYGPPVFVGVGPNLCPPLERGEELNPTTGEWSKPNGTNTMALDYYIPVDYSNNTYYTLSYNYSAMPANTRTMVFAYNANKEFVGRSGGNSDAVRTLAATNYTLGTPAGSGTPAYLRVRVYNATFSDTQRDVLHMQIEPGNTASAYRVRSMEYIN